MADEIDLRSLAVDSPDALKSLELTVGILQDRPLLTQMLAEFLERVTSWRVFRFETLAHARKILEREHLHIFIVHWHIGEDHSENNEVTQFVKQLKNARGQPGIGRGPFLVATVTEAPNEEAVPSTPFLETTYDFYFCLLLFVREILPALLSQLFLVLPSNVLRSDRTA
jgi:hypothetical protein